MGFYVKFVMPLFTPESCWTNQQNWRTSDCWVCTIVIQYIHDCCPYLCFWIKKSG